MRVTVRYHALLREKTGREREDFTLAPAQRRVADLLAAFVKNHAQFERLAPSLHVAVNDEIVRGDHILRENDLIDLMPPFGGG